MSKRAAIAAACIAATLAFALSACSPKSPEPADGGTDDQAASAASDWSMASDCTICHETQSESLGTTNCLAGMHASRQAAGCADCHADEEGLAQVHQEVDGPKNVRALKSTQVDEDACLKCHGTHEDLAEKTADYTGTTDSNGTTVNPHALPDVEGHSKLTCAYCHPGHKSTEDPAQTCLTCHHANVYECNTCHDA